MDFKEFLEKNSVLDSYSQRVTTDPNVSALASAAIQGGAQHAKSINALASAFIKALKEQNEGMAEMPYTTRASFVRLFI